MGQALVEKSVLIFEQQPAPGAHVRIWRYQDGRFLLEYMKPPSRRMMVFCPSFEEALSLWRQLEGEERPSPPDGPTNLTDGA